jgi:hypothetical protein
MQRYKAAYWIMAAAGLRGTISSLWVPQIAVGFMELSGHHVRQIRIERQIVRFQVKEVQVNVGEILI